VEDPGIFVSFNPIPTLPRWDHFQKDIAISSWMFKNPNYARLIAGALVHSWRMSTARRVACEQGCRGNAAAGGFDDLFNPALVG